MYETSSREKKKTPLKYTSNYIKTECHTYAHCTRTDVVVFKITTAAATTIIFANYSARKVNSVYSTFCAQFLFYSFNRTSKCTHSFIHPFIQHTQHSMLNRFIGVAASVAASSEISFTLFFIFSSMVFSVFWAQVFPFVLLLFVHFVE